jgi:hypothetical protein
MDIITCVLAWIMLASTWSWWVDRSERNEQFYSTLMATRALRRRVAGAILIDTPGPLAREPADCVQSSLAIELMELHPSSNNGGGN